MGAIDSFFDSVGDIFGGVLSWVEDEVLSPIADVLEWVNETVFEPVLRYAKAQIQAILDDPVKFAADVAIAIATGGGSITAQQAMYLKMAVNAADTLEEGGSLGDALKSAAAVYVTSEAGSFGDATGSFATEITDIAQSLGISDANTLALIGEAATEGAMGATDALIMGEDILEGFAMGAASVGMREALSMVSKQLELDGVDFVNDMPAPVQTAIATGLKNSLAQLAVTGEIDETRLARAVTGSVLTAEVMNGLIEDVPFLKEFITDADKLEGLTGDERARVLKQNRVLATVTAVARNTISAAVTGESVSDAWGATIVGHTVKWMTDAFKEGGFQEILDDADSFFDKLTGARSNAVAFSDQLQGLVTQNADAIAEYNELAKIATDDSNELVRLQNIADDLAEEYQSYIEIDPATGFPTGAGLDNMPEDLMTRLANAQQAVKDYEFAFAERIENDYYPRLIELQSTIDSTEAQYNQLAPIYESVLNDLNQKTKDADDALRPILNSLNEGVVKELNPDFDAEWYAENNDIGDQDPYDHYLKTGIKDNTAYNASVYGEQLSKASNSALLSLINAAGLNPNKLTKDQVDTLFRRLNTQADNDVADGIYANKFEALQAVVDDANNFNINTYDQSVASDLEDYIYMMNSAFADTAGLEYVVTEETNILLEEAGLPPQEVGSPLSESGRQALLGNEVGADIVKGDGVTDQDIADGSARIVRNEETGLLQWEEVELVPKLQWNDEAGNWVYTRPMTMIIGGEEVQGFQEYDTATGEPVGDFIPQSELLLVTSGNDGTLADLKQNNPEAYLRQLADLNAEAVASTGENNWWVEQVKSLLDRQQEYEDIREGSSAITALANFFRATEGVLSSFNGVVTAMGIDPSSTPFGKGLQELGDLADSYLPEEYVAAQEAMSKKIGDAKGISAKAKAIFGAFVDHPTEFLAEYIGVEAMQELAPLLIGGFVGAGTRGAAGFLKYADDAAKLVGQRAGVRGALVSDMAEAYGGTASSTYEEAFQLALENGLSEAEAGEYAMSTANTAGATAMLLTMVAAGTGGLALEKAILGGKATSTTNALKEMFEEVAGRMSRNATVTVKEGVTEGFEEGLTSLAIEAMYYQLDPNRDVLGNIAGAAMFGAIAGGPIASGTLLVSDTGDLVSNLVGNYNPQVRDLLASEGLDETTLAQGLEAYGVTDPIVTSNIMDIAFDEANVSTAEAAQAFDEAGYTPTQEEIDNFVLSNFGNANLATEVETYVDPYVLTEQDIRDYIAAEGGLDLTEAQINEIIEDNAKQYDDSLSDDERLGTLLSDYQQEVGTGIDQDDSGEEKDTDDDDDTTTTTTYTAGELVGPDEQGRYRIAGEDGETLSEEFYDKDGNDYVAPDDTGKNIYDYTLMETILPEGSFIRLENGDLVPANDPRFEGMYTDSNGNQNVDSIDIREGRARFNDDGVLEFVDSEGNYSSDDPVGTDADPVGTDADPVGTGLTEDQVDQIVQGVLDNLPAGISTEDVQTAIAAALNNADLSTLTTEDVQGIVNNAVKQITGGISDVQGTVDTITEQITKAEEAGIARDEALQGAINQVATDLGLTRTQLLEAIGETEQTLLGRLGEVETELSSDIQFVAEFVGKPAQEVTQGDIDFVASIIAEQQVEAEQQVDAQQLLEYDVNQDGVIDINDQTLLEQALAGQEVELAGQFAPTGLYAEQAQTQQDIQTAQDLATQQYLDLQQQIEATRQRANEERLFRDILSDPGQTVTSTPSPLAQIPYLYDISGESIFAPTNRTQLFSPYGASNVVPITPQQQQPQQLPRAAATGGLIARNNKLLKILGD